MKINKLFAAALGAALIFTACSKEDVANGPANQPTKASISVKFDLSSKSRTLDGISGDLQDRVNIVNANIFLVEGATGKIADSRYVSETEMTSYEGLVFNDDTKITTAITKVFVVTNTGNITYGINNKSDFYESIKSLGDLETEYKQAQSDGVIWSYGEADIDGWVVTSTSAGDVTTYISKADVTIDEVNPILSRIDFTVDLNGATDGCWYVEGGEPYPTDKSYVIMKGVAVLYSASNTHFIPAFTPSIATLEGTDPLVSGLMPEAGTEWDQTVKAASVQYVTAGDESFLYANWNKKWNGADNFDTGSKKFTRSFYCLAPNDVYDGNPGKAKPIITVYAQRFIWNDVAGEFEEPTLVFWPIHFDGESQYGASGSKKTLTMENGQRYSLTIKLSGDLSDPTGPGTTTPIKRYAATVDVTVEQAKWKSVIELEHEFEHQP